MIRFVTNGKENGKTAYLAKKQALGGWMTTASIVFDGESWVVRRMSSDRIDRFEKLCEAKDEVLKG
jgi:hypothetical protein